VSRSPVTTPASTITGSSLRGQVKGGQQPIWDATIQLYQVGTAGDGSSAAPLGSSTTTDPSGGFHHHRQFHIPRVESAGLSVGDRRESKPYERNEQYRNQPDCDTGTMQFAEFERFHQSE